MAILVKHNFVSPVIDAGNPNELGPDEWNDAHALTMSSGFILGRTSAGVGTVQELPVTDFATSAALTALSNSVSGLSSLGQNLLINGELQIDQANNGSSITIAAAATGYPMDRWGVLNSGGASITAGRTGFGTLGFSSCLRCTGAAGNTGVVVYQRIEGISIAHLASANVLLSAVLQASANRTVTWSARYANTLDNWAASTEFATGTINVTASPQRFDIPMTLASQAANGVQIAFSYGALGSGAAVDFTGASMIPGSTAQTYIRRPFGLELALCQRFLWKPQATAGFSAYASAAGQGFYLIDRFPVTMRASPVATTAYGTAVNLSNASPTTNPDYCEYTFTSGAAGMCSTSLTTARLYRAELN
jgi:hypothetical protein